MKALRFLICLFILIPGIMLARADTEVETHFENTDHELTIYYVNGKESGNTMMIIGGIQGDEPGGYLAADLYADMALEKGNLILVPRANFYSIKKNKRGVYGDMNRKFAQNLTENYDNDSQIVDILKNLMAKSDVLLNLHEGWGYYYPQYISEIKNPERYGQSIIIDALSYLHLDGTIIDLETPTSRVIEEINRNTKDTNHLFHLNNHDTFSEKSKHKEQRGSATYNALSLFGIPAYGIETSKNIRSIDAKVKYETLAINAFMREYSIIPEHPSISLPTPELYHLVVTIPGNSNPLAVKNGSTLSVPAGTSLMVSSVVANYKRGLSVDILGFGNTNDIGRVAIIKTPTTIKVYKDAYLCGKVLIETESGMENNFVPHVHSSLEEVKIKVHDKNIVVSAGDTLHIIRGDIIKIIDAWISDRSNNDFRINFYGFVGNKNFNDAEDRGYAIDTYSDLMERFSINGKGCLYRIEVLKEKSITGNVYIAIDEPEIQYIIVERVDGKKEALTPGEVINCELLDKLKILSIFSNVTAEPFIKTFVSKEKESWQEISLPEVFETPMNITFRRTTLDLGSISFR
ncbi:M99 family carboxypeptidase catalytic domain-containing protein [Candidatus Latescibacterota bacterium]